MERFKHSPNYSITKKRFQNKDQASVEHQQKQLGLKKGLEVGLKMLKGKKALSPKVKLPEIKPNLKEFVKPNSSLKFIWIGHSTFLVNIDGKVILFDPVFSDYAFSFDIMVKRFQAPILSLDELPKLDYIVLSHNHYDHLDEKTMRYFKNHKTPFLVPLGLTEDLVKWGIKPELITEFDWGESKTEGSLTFIFESAQHFSGRNLFDRNKTLWGSWIVKGENENLYFSGDGGYNSHFKEIGDKYGPFDVTFIENGQYNEMWSKIHMLPHETIQAHLDLRGKKFVPVHWGMFILSLHHWTEPVEITYQLAKEKNIPFLSPLYGEIVSIDEKKEFKAWWKDYLP